MSTYMYFVSTVVNSGNDHGEEENDGEDDQCLAKSDLREKKHLSMYSPLRSKSSPGRLLQTG